MLIPTRFHLAAVPKNYTGAAMADSYISLKHVSGLYVVITTGAWAGGTAAVTAKQATAVAGTGAKALGIPYVWTDKAAAGTFVKTAVTSNTFNLDTANSTWVIPVLPEELDVNGGFDCYTLAIASPGANADLYSVVYIASPNVAASQWGGLAVD